MTMSDNIALPLRRQAINIESAIDKSSFQVPVFVAISEEDGEAQVVKTFATAREVFDHVYSILLDRFRQRRAIDAVHDLMPRSSQTTDSRDTEYVLLVRGKAIFWFSGAAAKRAAGRRLLLEHARDLADAERTPFYKLDTRAKQIRAAIVVTTVAVAVPLAIVVTPVIIDWAHSLRRGATVSNAGAPDTASPLTKAPTGLHDSESRSEPTGAVAIHPEPTTEFYFILPTTEPIPSRVRAAAVANRPPASWLQNGDAFRGRGSASQWLDRVRLGYSGMNQSPRHDIAPKRAQRRAGRPLAGPEAKPAMPSALAHNGRQIAHPALQ
jgi:hypothetical protein